MEELLNEAAAESQPAEPSDEEVMEALLTEASGEEEPSEEEQEEAFL